MAIKFEGLEDIIKQVEKMADTSNVSAAIGDACALVEREARIKAPKGDGELRRSISSTVEGLTGEVFTPLDYAPYVEFGTGLFAEGGNGRKEVPWVYVEGAGSAKGKKTIHTEESANKAVAFLRSKGLEAYKTSGEKPHPFLRPALLENREKILAKLAEAVGKK
jgi:HK97 gp10 family phage protein